MSSTSATSASSTSSPTPTSGSSGAPQSSALYLFTFLATLLLLLAVSCAIVIRSFILRRRFRRRIEEAIAAGVLIPGSLDDGPAGAMGRRRRDFGEKPKLWEVWVDENGQMHEGSSDDEYNMKGEGKWEDILPVSATILSSSKSTPTSGDGDQTHENAGEPQSRRRVILNRMFSNRRPMAPPPPAPAPQPQPQRNEIGDETNDHTDGSSPGKERPKEEDILQVSVLISMPNPNARRMQGCDSSDTSLKGKGRGPGFEDADGEGDLPDVVFGVTEVNIRP